MSGGNHQIPTKTTRQQSRSAEWIIDPPKLGLGRGAAPFGLTVTVAAGAGADEADVSGTVSLGGGVDWMGGAGVAEEDGVEMTIALDIDVVPVISVELSPLTRAVSSALTTCAEGVKARAYPD